MASRYQGLECCTEPEGDASVTPQNRPWICLQGDHCLQFLYFKKGDDVLFFLLNKHKSLNSRFEAPSLNIVWGARKSSIFSFVRCFILYCRHLCRHVWGFFFCFFFLFKPPLIKKLNQLGLIRKDVAVLRMNRWSHPLSCPTAIPIINLVKLPHGKSLFTVLHTHTWVIVHLKKKRWLICCRNCCMFTGVFHGLGLVYVQDQKHYITLNILVFLHWCW